MAQYITTTDPVTGKSIREGVRNGAFVTDAELTSSGFAGTENVDWEIIETIIPE